jgi:Transposase DDE domain
MNRESQLVHVARVAYQLTKRSLRKYSHPNSPHTYSQPQVAACTLLVFYLNKSYRDGEEWLLASEQVCRALELRAVPDHSTLNRMFHQLNRVRLLRLLRYLLQQQAPREAVIALDSTGYRPSQASAYYQTRSGRRHRDWFKGAYAVGTASQLILAVGESHGGSANDARFLLPLKRAAQPYLRRHWLCLADSGFDGRAVTARDLIPPMRRYGKLVAPERKARADLVSQARLDGLFGQRWKTETVHSVIKRKFGDTVRSRSLRAQRREPILKALLYNIHR